MKTVVALAACASLFALSAAVAQEPSSKTPAASQAQKPPATTTAAPDRGVLFSPEAANSEGSVTVEGQRIDYRAAAGTIVGHPRDWDDAATTEQSSTKPDEKNLGDENN